MDRTASTYERLYCETSERVESDHFFPPNVEAALACEPQRVQNQSTLQDSMDSSERPHPLVNYSFTDDSDEESELHQTNGDTTDDEDIPSDDHQSGQMAHQTLQSKWHYFFNL